MSPDYDVIVIGSGFGGSVTALRLSEKGYRVGVLEQGARWRPEDYPPDSVPMRKTLWQPYFGLTGPLRITVLKNVAIQSAVGVGGGSLVYGNVLYEPPEQFYNDPQWASITDWKAELAPYYDQAKRMLGVATNPRLTAADDVFKAIADDLGIADTFHPTQVGAFFGDGFRPVLRWHRTRPRRLRLLWALHKWMRAQRQEHPRPQLLVPRGKGGRAGPPDGDRRRRSRIACRRVPG